MEAKSHPTDAGRLSNLNHSSGRLEPGAKLRDRIEKLEHRRIDPASLTFAEDEGEFHGGHAAVSKACMTIQRMDTGGMDFHLTDSEWMNRRREIDVAVKKIRVADDTDLERALGLAIREAEFLEYIHYPNVVKLQGFVEDVSKGIVWLIFPWADNGNLKDFIALLDWEIPERISLIGDVVDGLAYLHSREPPICHGDLKSFNILVFFDGIECRAAITDFGSARRLAKQDPYSQTEQVERSHQSDQPLNAAFCASTHAITLTRNNYTIRWAAPELLNEDRVSLWSDIWALGWIVYEVMTGSMPFQDVSSDVLVVHHVLQGDLPSLADNDHLSLIDELCSLMNMCWKTNPTERPTADACGESIKPMPKFRPENDIIGAPLAERILNTDQLSELGALYQSRGEYEKAFQYLIRAFEDSKQYGEPYQRVMSLCDLVNLRRTNNECTKISELHPKCRDVQEEEHGAKVLSAQAQADQLQYQYKEAIPLSPAASEPYTDSGGEKGRADALSDLADERWSPGQYNEAIALYSTALQIPHELGDRKSKVGALLPLALQYRREGKYNEATAPYSEILQICSDLGDREGQADALLDLAQMYRLQNRYKEAVTLSSEALQICIEIDDEERGGDAKINWLGGENSWPFMVCCLAAGIWESHDVAGLGAWWGREDRARALQRQSNEAIALYSEALENRTSLDERAGRADALLHLAHMHRFRHQYNQAIPLYSEALEIRTDMDDDKGRAEVLRGLADVHRLQEQYCEAIALYSDALQAYTDPDSRNVRATILWRLAEVHRIQSKYNEAISLYTEALEICTGLRERQGRAAVLWGLAQVHRLQRQYSEAIPLYSEALRLYDDLGDRQDKAAPLSGLAGES